MQSKFSKIIINLLSSIYCNTIYKIIYRNNPTQDKYSMSFDELGNFKIIQFADIQDGPDTNPRTLELMNRILDKEKPNLVVLTGDNIDGKCKTKEDVKQAITNIAGPMELRKIPWAIVFGNHDDEHFMMSKEQMMKFYMTFKYNVSQIGFKTGDRIGNYNLLIRGTTSRAPEFNIYLLDSGKYTIIGGYDFITCQQIGWYKISSAKLKRKNKKIVPALMFFHIPLQEFKTAYETNHIDGLRLEPESTSLINTGLFETIIKTGDVKGIFVGHDHRNTYTAALDGVKVGYAGNVGYATYGDPSLQRGARVFEINEVNPSVFTTRMIFSGEVGLD